MRRSTGSWAWFAVAMAADFLKGFVPVLAAQVLCRVIGLARATSLPLGAIVPVHESRSCFVQFVVAGVVLGHNYSFWMALITRRFTRTGKGLATGAGALLAYDWRYFVAVVVVGLARHRDHAVHDGRSGRGGDHATSWPPSCSASRTGRSRC